MSIKGSIEKIPVGIISILLIAKNISGWLSPKPLVPLMHFLSHHPIETMDNRPGQNLKKCGIGMGRMHPKVTDPQQLHIWGVYGSSNFQQVAFDNPCDLLSAGRSRTPVSAS
ncbi:MAG: hypothetical protein Q7T80_14005 [Methanoregula sp.]|nr:hypothetical protein [Methanoregula sp.]